jgi:hypothetical protein
MASPAMTTCGRINDLFFIDHMRNSHISSQPKIQSSERKSIRFGKRLETIREIPPASHLTASSYGDSKHILHQTTFPEEKRIGANKVLQWISSRNRRRRFSTQLSVDEKMTTVTEDFKEHLQDAGDYDGNNLGVVSYKNNQKMRSMDKNFQRSGLVPHSPEDENGSLD